MKASSHMYEELLKIDPQTAAKLHPHDTRKIKRSLDIFAQTGMPASTLYAKQAADQPQLRFVPTLCFWVASEQHVLDERLAGRIYTMEQRGMLKEGLEFQHNMLHHHKLEQSAESSPSLNFQVGICQAIGFKEFGPVFQYLNDCGWQYHGSCSQTRELLCSATVDCCIYPASLEAAQALLAVGDGQSLYQQCVAAMTAATVRYSKRQIKWIEKRFCEGMDGNMAAINTRTPLYTHPNNSHPNSLLLTLLSLVFTLFRFFSYFYFIYYY
eukprot:m.69975 g.69975  ORF g.69975 m.69975 type:complete len:268 (-) comp12245_c0_seq2:630-1433(-)